jgi:hypothetical protein
LKTPADLRELYGEIFVLELPDGQQVPFRLLSLADYFSYSKVIASNIIPKSIIENEIFEKCVVDNVLVKTIHQQKAGTPTVVADTILQYSAPNSSEELSYFINHNRNIVDNILYQIVYYICLGFNGYTPDDILSKNIHEIIFLLALAERKLLETGVLSEPLNFSADDNKGKKRRKKPKVDVSKLRDAYNQQQNQEWNIHKLRKQGIDSAPKTFQEDETPQFPDMNKDGDTVISGRELVHNLNADPTTDSSMEKQMLEEAKSIFSDYIGKIKKGEKIKIKDEEERIAEARRRMEENKKRFRQQIKKSKK